MATLDVIKEIFMQAENLRIRKYIGEIFCHSENLLYY